MVHDGEKPKGSLDPLSRDADRGLANPAEQFQNHKHIKVVTGFVASGGHVLTHQKSIRRDSLGNPIELDAVEQARQFFGVKPKPERRHGEKKKIIDNYRQLLNKEPEDLIAIFGAKVGEITVFEQINTAVSPTVLQRRIERLQKLIAASKSIIDGMASRIIKIRRGTDDPLLNDKAAREKYKREENGRIARCNAKLFRYRAALRSGNYAESVYRHITKPVLFSDVVDDHMTFRTITDVRWEDTDEIRTGGLHTHNRTELMAYFRDGHMDLDAYRAVMTLGDPALVELGETESEQKDTWDNIRRWENAVLRAAVYHGVIPAPAREIAELMGVGAVLDEHDDPIDADTTEDALAIKTGGACYGGRVKSEGFRYRNGKIVQRALSSFDKPTRGERTGPGGHDDPGFQSLGDTSDDAESYDPR